MNVFVYELKSYLKSFITWSVSLCLVVFILMSIYPGFASDAETIKDALSGYPKEVLQGFNINIDFFTDILWFYTFVFGFVLLVGAMQAMNLGVSMLSKEVREKTADFLLTKPITRVQIVKAKLLAALCAIVGTNILYLIVSFIVLQAVKLNNFSIKNFILLSLSLFFVQLFFLAIGFAFSVLIPKIKSVVSIALPTVFVFYIIGMLSDALSDKALYYLTPFKYFSTTTILEHGRYDWPFIVVEIILVTLLIGYTFVVYKRKDIHAI